MVTVYLLIMCLKISKLFFFSKLFVPENKIINSSFAHLDHRPKTAETQEEYLINFNHNLFNIMLYKAFFKSNEKSLVA